MGGQPGQSMTHSGKILDFDFPQVIKTICRVEAEDQGYRLHISGYSGTAGDSMTRSDSGNLNGMKFSTRDRDNDKWGSICAQSYKGGWWFNR